MSAGLLGDKVYEGLSALLGTPGFQAGEKLPSENALALRFNVSRPVVGQALVRLRTEGGVVSRKGSGNYVSQTPDPAPVIRSAPSTAFPTCVISSSSAAAWKARSRRRPRAASMEDVRREHRRIDTAIASGDPEQAKQAMVAHLQSGILRLFER